MISEKTKKISLSIIVGIVTFGISLCISFFVTPIIVEKLGSEAYGFVSLANNFVSYAALITVALNSMESRFVSIEIYKKNYEKANQYFTSVFFANVFIALVMAPIMGIFVAIVDQVLDIPVRLIDNVRATFCIVFIQFIVEILTSRFEIATYVTNKLHLYYINNIIASFIRLLTILIGFQFFSINIVFLVLGSLLGKVFVASKNVYYTKTFIPNLQVHRKYFNFGCIKEVLSAGVWNLISKLSSILLDGLDLLIANIFIGASQMGELSLSKTIPALFFTLRGTLDYPFAPPMTESYARGDIEGVIKYARAGNKLLGIFMIAPMAVFVVFGQSFFKLWVPSQNADTLEILSLLAIVSLLAGSCINSVFTIFTITNHVKVNSLVVLLTGILTTITVFILLKLTDLGVYAIAGVSSVYALIRNFVFTPLYGAHCLGVKKSTFYHEIITGNVCLVINIAVSFGISRFIFVDGWVRLIISCFVSGIICLLINFLIVFTKQERIEYLNHIKEKLKR